MSAPNNQPPPPPPGNPFVGITSSLLGNNAPSDNIPRTPNVTKRSKNRRGGRRRSSSRRSSRRSSSRRR